MALALTVATVQNITRVTGTVSGGAGGSATAVIFSEPGSGIGRGGFIERFRIKVVRLVAPGSVAKDYLALKDLGTTDVTNLGHVPDPAGTANLVWDTTMGVGPFNDQTNLGDEFRNGLQVSATTAATANDANAGYVFQLMLYHGIS